MGRNHFKLAKCFDDVINFMFAVLSQNLIVFGWARSENYLVLGVKWSWP